MSTNSSKWKKALLPSLGSRRRGRDPVSHVPASRTVSDISATAARPRHAEERSSDFVNDDVDDRIVNVLLETTTEAENESQSATTRKTRGIIHSQTLGTIHSKVTKLATPPRRSPKRNTQSVTIDFSTSSPKRSADGLVRPLPKFRSSTLLGRETRRILQSPSVSPGKHPARHGGKGMIRKSASHAENTKNPLVSVITSADDLSGRATGSTGFASLPKISRLRKNKVFTKLATALSDHFSKHDAHKGEKLGDDTETVLSANNESTKPTLHDLPQNSLTLAQLGLSDTEASSTSNDHCSNDYGSPEVCRGNWFAAKGRKAPSLSQKRLTMVEGSPPTDDPFSEEFPGRHSTEFEVHLKTVQKFGDASGPGPVASLTDPFLTEAIMDTSDNSILKTPPIGSSTPRTRVPTLVPIQIPTEDTQAGHEVQTEVAIVSPDGEPTSLSKRRKFAIICDSPTKLNTSSMSSQKDFRPVSASKARGSSDSTRLSSFPPGSTIRHVPRSMGRLTALPDLAASAAARRKSPKVGRKKHPSPSKRDLDMYGKFMEENVGLGVLKDTDELAMSFTSYTGTGSPALTPRDKNNMLRGSSDSHWDLGKGSIMRGPIAGLGPKSRSRIPQPVTQSARSRTETAFARDFTPANHGDSTTEDELQWNSSTYLVGRGHDHPCHCCDSMPEAV